MRCLATILRNEGVRGLWKGSIPSIVKAAPNAAITFAAYEAIIARLMVAAGEAPAPARGAEVLQSSASSGAVCAKPARRNSQ